LGDDLLPDVGYCVSRNRIGSEVNMATLTQTYSPGLDRLIVARKRESFIDRLIPRRCMIVSTGLILAGLGIPALMVLQLLPCTFLIGLAGFLLAVMGTFMVLFFCGEV
jgi:hypothetical protein